jgi:predicted O-linked N-acetylglucosamine transferase (SPINDLY family)
MPRSRLLMMVPKGSARQRVLATLADAGVSEDRVETMPFQPRAAYLAAYRRIDLGLDTFPYNGHTTTLDALWMGVPVVTLVGPTAVGRAGLSMLRNLNRSELAADTVPAYVECAAAWAADVDRLASVRAQLRERMAASAQMDAGNLAVAMEQAYRQMWAGAVSV